MLKIKKKIIYMEIGGMVYKITPQNNEHHLGLIEWRINL